MLHIRAISRRASTTHLASVGRKPLDHATLYNARPLALAEAAPQPNSMSAELLVNTHLALVPAVAKHYAAWGGVDIAELISEGSAALFRAATRFDPTRGVAFSSYALPWIHHAVRSARTNGKDLIPLPASIRRLVFAYRRMQSSDEPQRNFTTAEVALRLGVKPSTATIVMVASGRRRMTAATSEGSKEQDVLASIASSSDSDPTTNLEATDQLAMLRSAIEKLPDAERELVRLHYGLDGEAPLGSDAIAQRLSLPRVRVASGLQRALDNLRERMVARRPCVTQT